MKLSQVDSDCGNVLSLGCPDKRLWEDRPHRHRRRITAACAATMPADMDNEEERERWKAHAQEKCGFAIMTVISMAVLSWLIQKLCEYLWNRYKERHQTTPEDWDGLRAEAVRWLEGEDEE